MKPIMNAIKEAICTLSVKKCQLEAIMKWDFKVGNPRENFMQLCFSNLAAWPLFTVILILNFDPFRFSWSLAEIFSYDNSFILFLLDGRLTPMLVTFFGFFVAEWLFRKEYFFIFGLLFFLNKGELHINLALAGCLAVYLSRICYGWWMVVDSESKTRKIWQISNLLQFAAWLITAVGSVYAVDYLQVNSYFAAPNDLNSWQSRLNFMAIVFFSYHLVSHILLSAWGHFYFRIADDPSDLPVYYSTSNWILRFDLSDNLLSQVKKTIETQLAKYGQNQKQYEELKSLNPKLSTLPFEAVLNKEISYLKEAGLRISKI